MLQRSVTETRRLASGRPNVSRISGMRRTVGQSDCRTTGGIDPDLGPVDAQLLLPHRDPPQPVSHGDPGSGPALPDLRNDATQLPLDHLFVGGVLDRGYAVLL